MTNFISQIVYFCAKTNQFYSKFSAPCLPHCFDHGGPGGGVNLPWFWVRTCGWPGVPKPNPIYILGQVKNMPHSYTCTCYIAKMVPIHSILFFTLYLFMSFLSKNDTPLIYGFWSEKYTHLLYSLCFSPTAIGGALSRDQKLSDHIHWKWAFSLNTSAAKSFASAFQVNMESAPN